MEVKIRNNQARVLGLVTGDQLMPGENKLELTPDQKALIDQDPTFKGWKARGWVKFMVASGKMHLSDAETLKVREEVKRREEARLAALKAEEEAKDADPPADDSIENALAGVNLDQAETLIKSCSEPEILESWLAKDERKGAQDMIRDRLAELSQE